MIEKRAVDALPVSVDAGGRAVIAVRVIPRAPQTRLAGIRNGALLIRLAAPPVDGAANDALLAFLSDLLDCPRRQIHLTSGVKSRDKRVCIEGMSPQAIAACLRADRKR